MNNRWVAVAWACKGFTGGLIILAGLRFPDLQIRCPEQRAVPYQHINIGKREQSTK